MLTIKIPQEVVVAATSVKRVQGWTHDFYKYPARFSPEFAREAIRGFTGPDDVVLDPFVGGGTTLVEAFAAGRRSFGADINSLAAFISRVKTTILTPNELQQVRLATEKLFESAPLQQPTDEEPTEHYRRHLTTTSTWRVRRFLEFAKRTSMQLTPRAGDFLRLITLRTGQWAIDNKKEIPDSLRIRRKFLSFADSMIDGMREYESVVRSLTGSKIWKPRLITSPAEELHRHRALKGLPPKLILTSPPYPGVHMLYHRWQVNGRRETAFPYWLANSMDGQTASYYNLGSRHENELKTYFAGIQKSFESIAKLCDSETIVIQMLAFSEPSWQLPKYLETMSNAGFSEFLPGTERLWRPVPNRKWYTATTQSENTKMEVVLFHRLIDYQ